MMAHNKQKIVSLVALSLLVGILGACATGPAPAPAPAPGHTQTLPQGDPASRLKAGEAALDQGDLSVAEQEYRAATMLDPKSAQAQFGLGNVYVRQGRFADAETAYRAALTLNSGLNAARANLGVVYYQMGQLSKAATEFETVLRSDAADAQTTYLLAAVRLQENNLPEAERLLLRARELNPNLPEVYYGLGVLYKFRGQTADAIAAFEKFLAIGPGQDPSAMDYARTELQSLKGQ